MVYPWSGHLTHDSHLKWCDDIVEHGDGWIPIHQFLLHWFDVEHWVMTHVATGQLVLVRNWLNK